MLNHGANDGIFNLAVVHIRCGQAIRAGGR